MCTKISNKFAVIGHPIGHTMSPFIHQRLFSLSGKTPSSYDALDIPPQKLAQEFSSLRQLRGFNVTIPHKQAILPLLDQCSPQAEAFGSVNTVLVQEGKTIGYTTDGIGCLKALEAAGAAIDGPCLLLGSGGAARAIAFALTEACPSPCLTFAVREESLAKTRDLCASLALYADKLGKKGNYTAVSYETLEGRAGQKSQSPFFSLLLNCTSVGMFPHIDQCPVSPAVIACCGAVFDAVYNPHETRLLQNAKAMGIPVIHGMAMLVWQAVAAQEIWNGSSFQAADIETLIEDASREMARRFEEAGK